MNRDLEVLRRVVTEVTQLLAGQRLRVTQMGTQAYVRMNMVTGRAEHVNIPELPDNASQDLILGVQGFIDHEVSHILHTDFEVQKEANIRGAKFHSGWNIVEDTYIERAMAERFKGSGYNLSRLHDFFIDKITIPALADAMAKGDANRVWAVLWVPACRAWAGQRAFEQFMEDKWPLIQPQVDLMGDLIKEFPTLSSSRECFELADKMEKALTTPPPPPAPAPPQKGEPDGGKGETPEEEGEGTASEDAEPAPGDKGTEAEEPAKPNEEDGEGEEAGDSEAAPADENKDDADEDDAEQDAAAGDDGVHDDDQSEEAPGADADRDQEGDEDPTEDAEGSAGDSEDDEEFDEDFDDEDAAGAGDDAEDEADGEDRDDGPAGDAAGKPEESEDGEGGDAESDDDSGAGSMGDDDAEDADADEKGSGKAKAAGDASDDDQAEDGEDGEPGNDDEDDGAVGEAEEQDDGQGSSEEVSEGETNGETGGYNSQAGHFVPTPTELLEDMAAQLGKHLKETIVDLVNASDYKIFSRDFDRIAKFDPPISIAKDAVAKLDEQSRSQVGVMAKDIERMMAARSQVLRVPGFRSGKLHGGSLHRLTAKDDRVFRRMEEHKSKEVVVGLLVDCSGSMNDGIRKRIPYTARNGRTGYKEIIERTRMQIAMEAAYALSQTLERVNVKNECYGFTTLEDGSSLPMDEIQKMMKEINGGLSRMIPIDFRIFKDADERMTAQVKERYAKQHKGYSMMSNIDGESVEIAARRLLARKEPRKVLIVMSDGQPAGGNSAHLRAHLKRTVIEANQRGVETIGMGIQSDAVKGFYKKNMVLNDVADLPKAVMSQLKDILMAA